MKLCTDVSQSKILAEILPPESADMCYSNDGTAIKIDANSYLVRKKMWQDIEVIPCWSLAALLDAMPPIQELCSSTDHYYRVRCMNLFSEWHDNAIDLCVEMIVKLKEKGLL